MHVDVEDTEWPDGETPASDGGDDFVIELPAEDDGE